MLKRLCACLLALICALAPIIGLCEDAQAVYFYLTACESCKPDEAFAERFSQLTGKDASDYKVTYYNVYHAAGKAAYEQATRGLSEEERRLPLLIWNGRLYAGDSSINEALTMGGDARDSNQSLVWFLTAAACESCLKAHATIDGLPAVVGLWIDGKAISSPVSVNEVSISAEPDMALALFDAYKVPDDKRFAPAVFFGDSYLSGDVAIAEELLTLIKEGRALHTPIPVPEPRSSTATALGAAAAGFAAGFNPCAVSMLLVFLSMLLSLRRRPFAPGLAYLLGKLCVYLLIGLVFSRLWSEYAPAWFPLVARLVLTAIGVALIVVNLLDAYHARAQEYGRIRNQLPGNMRGRLRKLIGRSVDRGGIWLGAAAVITGAVVAAGEFMCAGQLYVAVLIANADAHGSFLPLLIYSLAFTLPSFAVLVIVSVSRKTLESSDWMLKRMPLIKLLTALMMAAVIAYTWIIR